MKEGAVADCQESLQSGFSNGLNISFKKMGDLGKLRGKLCALQSLYSEQTDDKSNRTFVERIGVLEHRLKEAMTELSATTPIQTESIQVNLLLQGEIDELTRTINNFITETLNSYHKSNSK